MTEQALQTTETLPDTSPDLSIYAPKGIPIEKIIEYRRKGLSTRKIAKLIGCGHTNIVKRLQAIAEDIDTLPQYKTHKADILTLTGKRILNHLTDAKLQKASAYQLTGMFGVINEHDRLERGQSTDNIALVLGDLAAIREAENE